METNNVLESTTNYQDAKRKSLHERLVLDGRVLKCTVSEAIELISGLELLRDLETQTGNLFLDEMNKISSLITDKIIIRYIKGKENELSKSEHEFIYWSPCSIIDFLAVSGILYYQTGTIVFEGKEVEVKISFLGKDIKKSLENVTLEGDVDQENIELLQNVLQNMVDEYFRSKYPIKESNYYFISLIQNDETNEFSIKISRDLKNSPKPQLNKQPIEENPVKKTVINITK